MRHRLTQRPVTDGVVCISRAALRACGGEKGTRSPRSAIAPTEQPKPEPACNERESVEADQRAQWMARRGKEAEVRTRADNPHRVVEPTLTSACTLTSITTRSKVCYRHFTMHAPVEKKDIRAFILSTSYALGQLHVQRRPGERKTRMIQPSRERDKASPTEEARSFTTQSTSYTFREVLLGLASPLNEAVGVGGTVPARDCFQ